MCGGLAQRDRDLLSVGQMRPLPNNEGKRDDAKCEGRWVKNMDITPISSPSQKFPRRKGQKDHCILPTPIWVFKPQKQIGAEHNWNRAEADSPIPILIATDEVFDQVRENDLTQK